MHISKILTVVFFIYALAGSPTIAESVPLPGDINTRYYIEVPKGHLKEFFRFHPLRIPLVSHHRGGPVAGYPENAIETMDNALRHGFGLMEVDIAELKDGSLILMHDDTLDRTTTGTGNVSDMSMQDVEKLYLEDNDGKQTIFRVPSLESALEWAKGRAILTLDIKRGTDFRKVAKAVEDAAAEDYAVAITYSLKQAVAFHKIAPAMMLTVSMYDQQDVADVAASGIDPRFIIAWTGTQMQPPAFYRHIHEQGWRAITGTFSLDKQLAETGENAEYLNVLEAGVDIIATDRFWAVQHQIRNPNLFYYVRRSPVAARH